MVIGDASAEKRYRDTHSQQWSASRGPLTRPGHAVHETACWLSSPETIVGMRSACSLAMTERSPSMMIPGECHPRRSHALHPKAHLPCDQRSVSLFVGGRHRAAATDVLLLPDTRPFWKGSSFIVGLALVTTFVALWEAGSIGR